MGAMVIKKGVERVAAYSILLYYIQLVYYPFGGGVYVACGGVYLEYRGVVLGAPADK